MQIQSFYKFLDPPLGKGSYGEVKKAIHKKTGILRAIKTIKKDSTDPEEQQRILNEVELLS